MRRLLTGITIISILLGYTLSKDSLDERVKERKSKLDIRYLPSPSMAKGLSMGFNAALADIFWIEALNYFGTEFGKKGASFKYIDQYNALILNLDPLFSYFYNWASTVYIYNGLPIIRERLVKAAQLGNQGIRALHEIGRVDALTLQKAAYTYALDAQYMEPSVDYFVHLGRSIPNQRDMLLIGATYANYSGNLDREYRLRLEYLSYKAYETQSLFERNSAFGLVVSSALVAKSIDFVRNLRVQIEKDDDLKELVEERLEGTSSKDQLTAREIPLENKNLQKLLQIDLRKNWMPPELHLIFSTS